VETKHARVQPRELRRPTTATCSTGVRDAQNGVHDEQNGVNNQHHDEQYGVRAEIHVGPDGLGRIHVQIYPVAFPFRRTRPHSRPGPIEGRSRGRRRLATRRTASTTSRMASVHTTRGRVQNGDVYEEQDGAYDEQSATTTSTTSRTEQNGVHDNQYSVRDEQNGIHEQNGVHDEQDRTLTSLPRRRGLDTDILEDVHDSAHARRAEQLATGSTTTRTASTTSGTAAERRPRQQPQ
jgi:hypothetical protein